MALGLVVLAFLAVVVRPWEDEENSGFGRAVLSIYALVSLGCLGLTVGSYLGLRSGGSPRIPARQLARIQQTGLYVRASAPEELHLTFTGDPIDRNDIEREGFQIPALASGQRIRLTPKRSGDKVVAWAVQGPVMDTPVRVGGVCVNAVAGGWLGPQEDYRFVFRPAKDEPRKFLRLRLSPTSNGVKITYSDGLADRRKTDAPSEAVATPIERSLNEGARATTLLDAGSLAKRWAGKGTPLALQAGADVNPWTVLSHVVLVRQRRLDAASKIGVLLDAGLADMGVTVERNGAPLDLSAPEATSEVPSTEDGSVVSFGFTGAHRYAMLLPTRMEHVETGYRMVAALEVPTSFPLPPRAPDAPENAPERPFLLTSGRDMVPLDGYVFATGNPFHPFYAKAVVSADYDGLTVQDGVSRRSHRDGDPIFLGDLRQGIVAQFHIQRPSVAFAGTIALAILGGLAIAFLASLWWRPTRLGKADVAWAFLWVASVCLLVVRLILAYRCSLVPPDDGSLADLASFAKALRVSLPALALLPLAMIAVRLRYVPLHRQRQWDPLRDRLARLPYDRYCLWFPALASLIPVFARLVGSRNDLLGFRTNVWTHLFLVGGLTLWALAIGVRRNPTEVDTTTGWKNLSVWRPHGHLWFVGLNGLALAMLVLMIGDNGSLVYGISIGLALLTGGLALRASQLRQRNTKFPIGLAVALGALTLGAVLVGFNTRFFVQRFESLNGTIAYRLASLEDMDPEMLLNPARTEYVEATQYRQNRDQQWQMLLYAATGASDRSPGYGGVPLSKIALKYPTSMTDTTYAVYLLGEFGPWAGAWTTALYLVLMAACFAGASAVRRERAWHFIPLLAVGAFYAVNGLYMAAANVGSVPFTGQNLPLLSLYSEADLVQSLAVLVLASALLRRPARTAHVPPTVGEGIPTAFGVVAGIGWVGIAWAGISLPARYTEDLDAPEVLKTVVRRVETGQVRLEDDETIDPHRVTDLTPIEKEAIREFNLRPDKADPESGLYYIEPNATGGMNLVVNRSYFHLTSPYKKGQGVPWHGAILARNAQITEPRLYLLSNPLSLSLGEHGRPAIAYLDSERPVRGANAAFLSARSPYGRIDFAECRRRRVGDTPVVTLKPRLPQALPRDKGWSVYIEGEAVPDSGRDLQPNDLISIEDRTAHSPRRFNLIYLGTQAEPLAFVRWRNGTYRRVLPAGPSFGMVANIGRVADDVKPKRDLHLTLDLDLHQRLQSAIQAWCLAQPPRSDLGWRRQDPERTKPVSMTVIDTFSGEVLALPSFPHPDPTTDDFASDMGRSGPIRRGKLLRNWNLENHVIGSTIKPLTFSTMAAQLLPDHRLETLIVHSRDLVHDSLAGIPLEDETDAYPPTGDIPMGTFLTQSRTWPACLIGALGLVESREDLKSVLVAGGPADITLDGRNYRMDLLKSPNPVVTQDSGGKRYIPRTNLSETLLFKGLTDLFGIQTPANKTKEEEAVHGRIRTFLPSLDWTDASRMPTYATEVVPRRVLYECDSMRSVKQELLTSLIGGAQSLWNNVAMAEAFARLCTGRRVVTHLELQSVGKWPSMPAPINNAGWRERALLAPLEQVHVVGTAKTLQVDFKGYRAVMKTGTLGEEVDSESLMFTIGKFERDHFVPGQTITGYFFMRDTNTGGNMLKFSLADTVLPILVDYLGHHPAPAAVPDTDDAATSG